MPDQAVALVFEHVDVDGAARHSQLARSSAAAAAPSSSSPRAGVAAGGRSPLVSQGSLGSVQGSPGSASGVLAEHGPANAALKLLDNLCMMLTGRSGHARSRPRESLPPADLRSWACPKYLQASGLPSLQTLPRFAFLALSASTTILQRYRTVCWTHHESSMPRTPGNSFNQHWWHLALLCTVGASELPGGSLGPAWVPKGIFAAVCARSQHGNAGVAEGTCAAAALRAGPARLCAGQQRARLPRAARLRARPAGAPLNP